MPMATDASESIYLDAYNQFDEIEEHMKMDDPLER